MSYENLQARGLAGKLKGIGQLTGLHVDGWCQNSPKDVIARCPARFDNPPLTNGPKWDEQLQMFFQFHQKLTLELGVKDSM